MDIEKILDIYRTALLRISGGISPCIDGTISLESEDMQAIARRAIDTVAGLGFDEEQAHEAHEENTRKAGGK